MAHFIIAAIPLNRPGVSEFLLPPTLEKRGLQLRILNQRPKLVAENAWLAHLQNTAHPTVVDLLRPDHPAGHLTQTDSSRLVPVQFLQEEGFLTRNLGGWTAIYFALIDLPTEYKTDPLLQHTTALVDYGAAIRYFGADPQQVAGRIGEELETDLVGVVRAWRQIARMRPKLETGRVSLPSIFQYVERLYTAIGAGENRFAEDDPPLPRPVLLDELTGWLVRLEAWRRLADADGDTKYSEHIARWQTALQEETGLRLILKGEYIVGRHRRSTVLIAPELGVVVKQPAPEPWHEIVLGNHEYNGQAENWPVLTGDQSLVTARGRIRQVLAEGLLSCLHQVLNHRMEFHTMLGLTIEPFIVGPTVQEYVWRDAQRLTPDLYAEIILHQQVAEVLGVENGDWHAANFVVRETDSEMVHIDWGAARSLRVDELNPAGERTRLNQVRNIAYSFHDPELAVRTEALHNSLLADADQLARIRQRAEELVANHIHS
jgi:hypothetical protein